jgi:hypothetical protein
MPYSARLDPNESSANQVMRHYLWLFTAIAIVPALVMAQSENAVLLSIDDRNASRISAFDTPLSFPHAGNNRIRVGAGSDLGRSYISLGKAADGRRSYIKGAAIGFGIGAVVGAAAYTAGRCSRFKDPLDGSCVSVGTSVTIGGAIGGLVGAGIGVLVTSLSGSPPIRPAPFAQ